MISSCGSLTLSGARDHAATLTLKAGWLPKISSTLHFDVLTYRSPHFEPQKTLTIVLEGDGRAWLNKHQPSNDPTPLDPVGLRLALSLNRNAVYIARPCQFVEGGHRRNCSPVLWTNARFSPEIVNAVDVVINQYMEEYGANELRLVGFSGGGTLAALLTVRRSDVIQLVTVAAPLDIHAWTKHHGISSLRNSLNPADQTEGLAKTPQIHIVGQKDKVVPLFLTKKFILKLPVGHNARLIMIEGADHLCCWNAPLFSLGAFLSVD